MNVNEIEDVLNVTTILSANGADDHAHQPYLIAALIDWADSRSTGEGSVLAPEPEPEKPAPKAKRGKATEPDVSDEPTTTPDPSEPDF